MKIDIVIATYNRAKQLGETIENVLQFEQDINKFYIINNASQDNTQELLNQIDHPKVVVFNNYKNLGAPGGKNVGLKESDADIVVVIDDDAIFYSEDPIREIERIFNTDKALGIIQFKIVNYYEKRIHAYEFPGGDSQKDGDTEFECGYFIGAGHAIKKDMLEQCGYYPDSFFYAHEEVDLSYRAINAGFKIKYCPSVSVYHKKDPGGRLKPNEVILQNFKNRLIMSYCYLPLQYRAVSNLLWFVKTLLESKSFFVPIKAIRLFGKEKKEYTRDKLSRNAIDYLKRTNGRLYR